MNAPEHGRDEGSRARQLPDDSVDPDSTFGEIARLDKLIHEPARLALLSALSVCEWADFTYLQRITALSKGNLSAHLTTLGSAGVVVVEKGYEGRRPKTWVRITAHGQNLITDYWTAMARWHDSLAPREDESPDRR